MARWRLWDICYGFHLGSSCKVKARDPVILYSQAFHSLVAVFDSFLRGAGNITEAPPVADEARRCWRKTRSIAPAPRAIGDYAPARLRANVPSCQLRAASYVLRRGVAGVQGGPVLLFFCRRFLFQIKRKCRNAGSIYCLIIV